MVSQPAFFVVSQLADEPNAQHAFFAVSSGGLWVSLKATIPRAATIAPFFGVLKACPVFFMVFHINQLLSTLFAIKCALNINNFEKLFENPAKFAYVFRVQAVIHFNPIDLPPDQPGIFQFLQMLVYRCPA